MALIERTAYPRFTTRRITVRELEALYTLTPDELAYIQKAIRGDQMRLNFAVQLKVFQRLHYFPELKEIPVVIMEHIKKCLSIIDPDMHLHYKHITSCYRHHRRIREYLSFRPWANIKPRTKEIPLHPARHQAISTAYRIAGTMNYSADIINVVIEDLINNRFELPSFYTLNRLVKHVKSFVNINMFNIINKRISPELQEKLDSLLMPTIKSSRTSYNVIKQPPKNPTITHFKELLSHHDWLMSLGNMEKYLKDISKIKCHQFAIEAKSLDASDLKDMTEPKRYALIICLIHSSQHKIKDALATMFCKTMAKIHKRGQEKLEILRNEHLCKTHHLLNVFSEILTDCAEIKSKRKLLFRILQHLEDHGGTEILRAECEQLAAYNSKNYLPLLREYYAPKRSTLFKLIKTLDIRSAIQNDSLFYALQTMLNQIHKKSEYINKELDLSFASWEWKQLIIKTHAGKPALAKIHFEICVFSYIADALNIGNLFVEESDTYANYRGELIDEEQCDPLIINYCHQMGFPDNAKDFVAFVCEEFSKRADHVDQQYPDIVELVIDEKGYPALKKRTTKASMVKPTWLAQEIRQRLPERNLLDILCSTHHYTGWAYEFQPLSDSEPKLDHAIERYIQTTFAIGTCMGPTQAARHMKSITAHMLSWINRRHVVSRWLERSCTKLINCCNTFPLVLAWGDGKSCAADGTLRKIREENLIAEFHLRYGSRGGIAYHHVANNYIALFSTFIPCGVWEAVEIIEALLKNKSDIQPHIIHADTQGQSTVVFALAFLLGIKLMPRIRNWKDLKLFRPTKNAQYKHIDSLFSDPIRWRLIEKHWKEMMRIVLTIKQGKLTSSLLLRKLSSSNNKDPLYQALQELGRVIRTQFLLEYISDVELREIITAETNKVEAYHALSEWASFGASDLVASNDEEEMEKAIKYNEIITTSVILQNIADITDIIYQLVQEGKNIARDDVAGLSPYIVEHIKRFGNYVLDLHAVPNEISRSREFSLW